MIHDAGDTGLYSDSFSHATTLTFSLSLSSSSLFSFYFRLAVLVSGSSFLSLPGVCYPETVHGNFVLPSLYIFLQEYTSQI